MISRRLLDPRRSHRGEGIEVRVLSLLPIALERIEIRENVKFIFGRVLRRSSGHRSVRGPSSEDRRFEVDGVGHGQLVEVESVFFEEVFGRLREDRSLVRRRRRRSHRCRMVRDGRPVEAELSVRRITIFVEGVVAVSRIEENNFFIIPIILSFVDN